MGYRSPAEKNAPGPAHPALPGSPGQRKAPELMDALPGILIASSANPGPFPASYTYFMEPDGAHFAPETGKSASFP